MERVLHLRGGYCAASLLGVKICPWLINRTPSRHTLCLAVLEAMHWDSAGKPLAQVPGVVFMEVWTGKMAGSWDSSSLKSLKMVCLGHEYSSLVCLYKRAQFWLQVGLLPHVAFFAVRVRRSEANMYCFEIHLWLSERKDVLPPASPTSQGVQGLVIFTLQNSGGSS